jgi:hypothetical protein
MSAWTFSNRNILMQTFTIELPEEVANTVRRSAKARHVSEVECVTQILRNYHSEFEKFEEGVLSSGREKLSAILAEIPGVSDIQSSGIGRRHWWVSFHIDWEDSFSRSVLRRLSLLLNTMATEMMLHTVFYPEPSERPDESIRWRIASTAPLLDPADVVAWLRDNLPSPICDRVPQFPKE